MATATKEQIDSKSKGVLVIYTGGTIGSMPIDPNDPDSPQRVVGWEEFVRLTPEVNPESDKFIGFPIGVHAFETPLDSCNVGPAEWREMAEAIEKSYDDYEGFVILHGTDTMVYTACALSFMLENLAKPVIVTGAQIPHLAYARNDSVQNLITALNFANPHHNDIPVVPEVAILFNNVLLRGNRTRKADSTGFDAYESPNYPNLGHAGQKLQVNARAIKRMPRGRKFKVNRRLDTNVISTPMFPGIQNGNMVQTIMRQPDLKGAIIWAYGTGNIPTNPEFLETLDKANDAGTILVNVTQCRRGFVELGVYETSAELLEIGMVTGFDMSPEAALSKLMVLLGNEDYDTEDVKREFEISLAGESSRSVHIYPLKGKGGNIAEKQKPLRLAPGASLAGTSWSNESIHNVALRLYGATVEVADEKNPTQIEVWLDLGSDEEPSRNDVRYCGSFDRRGTDRELILTLPITETAKAIMTPSGISVSVRVSGNKGALTWKRAELAVFIDEDLAAGT